MRKKRRQHQKHPKDTTRHECKKFFTSLLIVCSFAIGGGSLSAQEVVPVPAAKPDEPAIAKLIKQLDSDDFEEREAAQAKLIELGSPAKAAVQSALADKKSREEVKSRAATIFQKIDLREKLSPKLRKIYSDLEAALLHDKSAWVKYFLLAGKAKEKNDLPIADLEALDSGALHNLNAAENEKTGQLFKIFTVIENLKLIKLSPELIACLKDVNERENVRNYAAYALGKLNAKDAIPELIARLKDEKDVAKVRMYAAYALGELRAKESIPVTVQSPLKIGDGYADTMRHERIGVK